MGQIIYFMYYTHMDLVCMKLQDRKKAYEMFRDIERTLRAKAPDLYQRTATFPYLRVSRKMQYLNIRWCNKPVIMALDLARKVLGRTT